MNKIVKRIFIGVGVAVCSVILVAGSYVSYVMLSYNRIGNCDIAVDRKSALAEVQTGQNYKAISYNIGFGAYSQDYTFFMDTGYDDDGKPTCGYWSKGRSKDEVEFNTKGAIETALNENPDFVMFQEVDKDSTRSYHIDQDRRIQDQFGAYDHTYAVNFHTAFLPYPFYDMHGAVLGGMSTISRYQLGDSRRISYTISDSLSRFFDLDRCFTYSKVKVNAGGEQKWLYLANSHMSAYDEGGKIREKQVQELNAFLTQCAEEGAYVVLGGDWNHDLLRNNPDFSYTDSNRPFGMTKRDPDWLAQFFSYDEASKTYKSPLPEGYKVVASDKDKNGVLTPTCRNNDIEWEPGKTFTCCVDGFIVSNNVKVNKHYNIRTKNGKKGFDEFAFSDHDPSVLEFELI